MGGWDGMGWKAGTGTDKEAPEGGMYKGCSGCRPLWPISMGKVSSGSRCRSLQFKTAAGVGV